MPSLPLAALVLAAHAAAPAPAQSPALWRWHLERGEVLRYRVTREQSMDFRADSMHRAGSMTTAETFTLTVEDLAADGVARVQIAFDALVAKFDDDDDDFDAAYDSAHPPERYSGDEMHFREHAARLGTTVLATIAPDGTLGLPPPPSADDEDTEDLDERYDPVGWACILPEAARLPRDPLGPGAPWTSRQRFEATFALEHGLFPWPIVADVAVRPDGRARAAGIDCSQLALAARFALVVDEPSLREAIEQKRILLEPSTGKGSLLVSPDDGVLAKLDLEGTLEFYVALEEGQVATRSSTRTEIRNRLAVELLERRPPPR